MLRNLSCESLSSHVAGLNDLHTDSSAETVLRYSLNAVNFGQAALVSSFGAESVTLLHLVSCIDRSVPILFLDTQMLFPETLDYQVEVSERLGLRDVRIIHPNPQRLMSTDPDNTLHQRNYDACCALRKTKPLEHALAPFGTWISGRKRFQGSGRSSLEFFELDSVGRIKVNPLVHWTPDQVKNYMIDNHLPEHPLVSRGYPSIGCATCTSKVTNGEDARAGRWRGENKDECGIHFVNGKTVRKTRLIGDA